MADIGQTLREARMRARIDITEVESGTKIRAKYLRAIENEEWDLLPGPVYIKSFLRTYGDYLGLDSRLLVDEFKRRYERPSDHDLRPMSTLGRERERSRGPRGPVLPSWAIVAGVLIAVLVVLGIIGSSTGPNKPTPASSTAKVHRHRRHRLAFPVHTATTRATPPPPTTAKLQIVPTGRVYVCVEDGAGHNLIPGVIYDVGQTIPAVSSSALLVTLGNNAVHVTADGKPYPVAASTNAIGFKVTPTGVTPLSAGQLPTCG